jgi:hypothetical protein
MITTTEIEGFLRKLQVDGRPLSGKSRNNYRGAIGTLFYFAESRGYVAKGGVESHEVGTSWRKADASRRWKTDKARSRYEC